jgi:pyruvate-ferredoxin/flavodoxin oxidoreductase
MDGNEAAASVAHRLSDVCALYPITPSSPMGELADQWSGRGQMNLWGHIPKIIEMQSEAGAIATLHGAVQAGALATSFTSSQGLLLMLPNMFKIAGELTPAVLHVAARAVATHALSIFGDHSDVMAARSTGWALLAANSVQEAHDFAAIAHAASLESRLPFIHFFDGFRTSHEVNRIQYLASETLRALVDEDAVLAHRARALTPARPVLRGTAQNPDVFFQGREAANPYYDAAPGIVAAVLDRFAALTGRRYGLVEYCGAPDADRVVVAMGSGVATLKAASDVLNAAGAKTGVLAVHLYRPFPAAELVAALPPTARAVAVLDRVKEPGAEAQPLHLDVVTALAELRPDPPAVIGGRYGLGSKEFAPRDAAAVFAELEKAVAGQPAKRRFTVGIADDVTHLSLTTDPTFQAPVTAQQALFYGLGSDGTVGANKNSVKIVGDHGLFAQGYFVYDSKKSGSTTVSHLRFGPEPIDAPYLVEEADFIAVHQFGLLAKLPVLDAARPGATVLLAEPARRGDLWTLLPAAVQHAIVDKQLEVYAVNAAKVAHDAGLGGRINTVMQACFFALARVMPVEDALAQIKAAARKTYAKRGDKVIQANLDAVDHAVAAMHRLAVPQPPTFNDAPAAEADPATAGEPGVLTTIRALIAGQGDALPVSALPAGGTFPTDTAKLEKRSLAVELPAWAPDQCIDCGKCTLTCPHAALRMKAFAPEFAERAPAEFTSKATMGRDFPAGTRLTVQVAPDDCTGCSVCVSVCPANCLTMVPADTVRDAQRVAWDYYLTIPETDRTAVRTNTVKGSQLLEPLFEFSGACDGCGETPYLKLLTQLMGDRMVVANATGCSSIYGGNLPTTPWAVTADGYGPAWNNSLFEDNAEFGMGLVLGTAERAEQARALVARLALPLGLTEEDVAELIRADLDVTDEAGVAAQRARVTRLLAALDQVTPDAPEALDAAALRLVADALVPTAVWVVGGDGWAYDIGFGGLDHLFASGQNINVLVLDTEVYSNTGGQASKATPLGASAKFAVAGKATRKKDLGLIAQAYGTVYTAQIALNANEPQAVRALLEAAAYPGPSLVIAYGPCIAHGVDLSTMALRQKDAVASGHWPLYRYHPEPKPGAAPTFKLDSKAPTLPLAEFYAAESRYGAVAQLDPGRAAALLEQAQTAVDERWARYLRLAEK